jgi:hypothetical protein
MAQAETRKQERMLAGAAGGGVGGTLAFLIVNRAVVAWDFGHFTFANLFSWGSLLGLCLVASVPLAVGAFLGAALGTIPVRSLRVIFWAGLAFGLTVVMAVVPQLQLVRE